MEIKCFNSLYYFSCNTYLLIKNNHCLLIDCGTVNDELINEIKKYQFDGVILTHKHFDHIQDLEKLNKYFSNSIYSFDSGDNFFSSPILNCSKFMCSKPVLIKNRFIPLKEGKYKIGEFDVNIIYTPGHTNDSICIVIDDNIFTGDLIFVNDNELISFDEITKYASYGRTDLPTSNSVEEKKSIQKIGLLMYNNKYRIYSGH